MNSPDQFNEFIRVTYIYRFSIVIFKWKTNFKKFERPLKDKKFDVGDCHRHIFEEIFFILPEQIHQKRIFEDGPYSDSAYSQYGKSLRSEQLSILVFKTSALIRIRPTSSILPKELSLPNSTRAIINTHNNRHACAK